MEFIQPSRFDILFGPLDLDKELFFMDENQRQVKANDDDIKRQVPGITTMQEKKETPNQNLNEELFFRAIGR